MHPVEEVQHLGLSFNLIFADELETTIRRDAPGLTQGFLFLPPALLFVTRTTSPSVSPYLETAAEAKLAQSILFSCAHRDEFHQKTNPCPIAPTPDRPP